MRTNEEYRLLQVALEESKAREVRLLSTLSVIASIAHCGGMSKMTESDALTAVRKASLSYLDLDFSEDQHRSNIAILQKGGAA